MPGLGPNPSLSMRCWLDLELGSEVMASGFLSCFMIMVTNYFEILQEEKWLGYGPSIQCPKNGEKAQFKQNTCLLFFLALFLLKRNSPIIF